MIRLQYDLNVKRHLSHKTFWTVTDTEIRAQKSTNQFRYKTKIHCALKSNLIVHDESRIQLLAKGNFSICRAKFSFSTETADLLYTPTHS